MASMLHSIDKALAGAIDVIADDISAGVKAVNERGMMDTLSNAMEEAGNMMHSGASAMIGPGPASPAKAGGGPAAGAGDGMGGYGDVCAGGGGSGGVYSNTGVLPYTPDGPMSTGSFAPETGIQRADPTAASSSSSPATAKAARGGGASSVTAKEPPLEQAEVQARFDAIRKEGSGANSKCFDCGAANVDWCSVSFGCLVCIECSGSHRQMGTHISRVRSCRMDSWGEKQLQVFAHGGNARLAQFFEANALPSGLGFQRYQTPAAEWFRESWIKNRFLGLPVPPPPSGVAAGPCSDAPPRQQPAPIVDLMDLDSAPSNPTPGTSGGQASAPVVDLLAFDAPATPAAQETPGATPQVDLFSGFGGAPKAAAPDLLDFGLAAPPHTSQPVPQQPSSALDLLNFDMSPAPAMQPAASPFFVQQPATTPSPSASLGMPSAGMPLAFPGGLQAASPSTNSFPASFPANSSPANNAFSTPAFGQFSTGTAPAFPAGVQAASASSGTFPPYSFPTGAGGPCAFPSTFTSGQIPTGGFPAAGAFAPSGFPAGGSPAGGFPKAGAFSPSGFPAGGPPAGAYPQSPSAATPSTGPRTMAEGAKLMPPPPRVEKEEDNFLAMAKQQYNM